MRRVRRHSAGFVCRTCLACFLALYWSQSLFAQQNPIVLRHTYNDRDMRAVAGAFSPDGRTIAVCFGASVTVWETGSGERIQNFENFDVRILGFVGCLAFSPNGKLLLAGDEAGFISVWDLLSGELLRNIHVPVHENYTGLSAYVSGVAFTQNGREIVALRGYLLTFWDVESGEEIRRVRTTPGIPANEREFGRITLLGNTQLALFHFSETESVIVDIETGNVEQIFADAEVALSGDQSRLLSMSESGSLCTLSDPITGTVLQSYNGDCTGTTPALSPNGEILAYSRDNVIYLDALRPSGVREPLTTFMPEAAGTERIWDIRISPTGNQLAVRLSRSVYLYDISEFVSSVSHYEEYGP